MSTIFIVFSGTNSFEARDNGRGPREESEDIRPRSAGKKKR